MSFVSVILSMTDYLSMTDCKAEMGH